MYCLQMHARGVHMAEEEEEDIYIYIFLVIITRVDVQSSKYAIGHIIMVRLHHKYIILIWEFV